MIVCAFIKRGYGARKAVWLVAAQGSRCIGCQSAWGTDLPAVPCQVHQNCRRAICMRVGKVVLTSSYLSNYAEAAQTMHGTDDYLLPARGLRSPSISFHKKQQKC